MDTMNGTFPSTEVRLPLRGRKIVITRAREQLDGFVSALRDLGATPIECPAICITPLTDPSELDAAIHRLDSYDWVIFTSVNGVHAFARRMVARDKDISALQNLKVGVIGPATRVAVEELGFSPSFMPDMYVAEAIIEQIGNVQGERILLPRADIARETLAIGLRERGALVDEVAAYHTLHGETSTDLVVLLRSGEVDAITFTSSSTVRYTIQGLVSTGLSEAEVRTLLERTAIVCIGPITAGTAQEYGLPVVAVAEEYTIDGLVAALITFFGEQAEKKEE
jgi:uroporphyrinogen III methyltransferase/synthase